MKPRKKIWTLFITALLSLTLTGASCIQIGPDTSDDDLAFLLFLLLLNTPTNPINPTSGDAYEPDNTYLTATPLSLNTSQNHTIHTGGDVDYFSISVVNGGSYILETDGGTTSTCDMDTYLTLYNSDGTTVGLFDDDGGFGLCSYQSFTANFTGTGYVSIRGAFSTSTGSYRIRYY